MTPLSIIVTIIGTKLTPEIEGAERRVVQILNAMATAMVDLRWGGQRISKVAYAPEQVKLIPTVVMKKVVIN